MPMTRKYIFTANMVREEVVSLLTKCNSEIKSWMDNNFLCLNNDKTKVMLIGSPHQLSRAYQSPLIIGSPILKKNIVGLT